jgi:GntR family transcriptional repressor for pyruvate dehydrogenase complex
MLEPVKRSRLYQDVVRQIKDLITNGTLKPGDQLPSERELSEALQVSRPSVREALRALETMGYIESRVGVGGGSFVRQITINDVLEPLSEIFMKHKKSILELQEVRLILESETAGLAAQRRKAEDLTEIEQSLRGMEQEIGMGELGMEGDNAFHNAIARATHNDVLITFMSMFGDLQNELRTVTLNLPGQPGRSLQDHKDVYEAVKEGDRTQAVKSMRDHILKAWQNIEREL